MDVKTRIMIDKITEYVRKEYKIIGPISDIEGIVVSMGGIIVEKTAIDDLSDIWIRKSGKESFEIFLPPVQISWTIERRNFMIAHELGHLFLHMGFRINDDKWNNQMKGFYRNNDAETNYQANEFAKAFLMPEEEYGEIYCNTEKIVGTQIHLDLPSVGATENIILASCLGEGTTVITNAAREPEIEDMIKYLNKMGAKINGAGTDKVEIIGVKRLAEVSYNIMPDRIEAGSFLCFAAATKGNIILEDVNATHITPIINKLEEAECKIEINKNKIK